MTTGINATMGAPIIPEEHFGRRVATDAISPELAMREVVAAYLAGLVFTVHGAADPQSRTFQFREVFTDWPDPGRELPYPCGSVGFPAGAPLERHNFAPSPLEDTRDVFGANTVLWKVGEYVGDLQFDAWTNTTADRDAVRSRMHGAFAPGEDGTRVFLVGHPRYYGLVVKCSLTSCQDLDTQAQVYANERRLRTLIVVSIEAVELRCGVDLDPEVQPVLTFDTDPVLTPE